MPLLSSVWGATPRGLRHPRHQHATNTVRITQRESRKCNCTILKCTAVYAQHRSVFAMKLRECATSADSNFGLTSASEKKCALKPSARLAADTARENDG